MIKKTIAGGQSLPFPAKPSGSIAGRTMQESVYSPLPKERRLPEDAPNILIVPLNIYSSSIDRMTMSLNLTVKPSSVAARTN